MEGQSRRHLEYYSCEVLERGDVFETWRKIVSLRPWLGRYLTTLQLLDLTLGSLSGNIEIEVVRSVIQLGGSFGVIIIPRQQPLDHS